MTSDQQDIVDSENEDNLNRAIADFHAGRFTEERVFIQQPTYQGTGKFVPRDDPDPSAPLPVIRSEAQHPTPLVEEAREELWSWMDTQRMGPGRAPAIATFEAAVREDERNYWRDRDSWQRRAEAAEKVVEAAREIVNGQRVFGITKIGDIEHLSAALAEYDALVGKE